MIVVRIFRVGVIALALSSLFAWSQRTTLERSGESVPGLWWAVGVLSLLFLVSAFATERTSRFESALQKDLLWGLGTGGILALLNHLSG
jgi:hypothetical protein